MTAGDDALYTPADMSTTRPTPGAVVFDFDGTIADTQAIIVSCFRGTYENLGIPAPDNQIGRASCRERVYTKV